MADEPVNQARQLIKQFGSSLKGELISTMKKEGPVKAIEICNLRAPQIAAEVAAHSGWEVGRSSLRLRSADNQPDAWEMKVLKGFEARKDAGEDPGSIDYSETVQMNGQKTFRYMKAIPTEKACLTCHGTTVDPAIESRLQDLYPNDQARGYKEGDIRGAFTLSKRYRRGTASGKHTMLSLFF